MKMMRCAAVVVGLTVVVSALSGCVNAQYAPAPAGASGGEGSIPAGGPELVAMTHPPIPDLPVPTGFRLDESRSRNFRGGSARYVDHLYKGSSDKFAVGRFYMRQMPIQRWTLTADRFVQGDVIMDFQKESENCQIMVVDGGPFRGSEIRVMLWTSGRMDPVAKPRPDGR